MNKEKTSPELEQGVLTQHAMLVAWGLYAEQLGLISKLEGVKLKQKTRRHRPQTKVLEFLVAMLAGLPHLQDISRSAHPLDQDGVVAKAWGQPAWADYSGVSRTLQGLSAEEAAAIAEVLVEVTEPIITREIEGILQAEEKLVYDADLTGRPVSNTSSSYPNTAFGYMGDTVSLGYQAALVSFHSPSFGRLWLGNQLHPGDTVSATEAQTLVRAAEERTGVWPRRRVEWVERRLQRLKETWLAAEEQAQQSEERLMEVQSVVKDVAAKLAYWRREATQFEGEYRYAGRQTTSHCKLTRAKRRINTYEKQLPRRQKDLAVAERRWQRHDKQADSSKEAWERLQRHYEQLLADNVANPHPVQAVFRLDGGFASRENIDWLIEMGYDIYTKSRSTKVRDTLSNDLNPDVKEQRVGGNATLTAWASTTVDDYYTYPMNVALARYHTGDTSRRSVLLHFGDEAVTDDLDAWFHAYNGRQTIEAGIKEGKGVFQMHHLKVRSTNALLLQEHFACFAANFVRFAAHWLTQQQTHASTIQTHSVKHMVTVIANTSAQVWQQGDVWFLRFTEQSFYAGLVLRFGKGAIQLPLPLYNFQNSYL